MSTDYFGEAFFEKRFWRRSRTDMELRAEMLRHLEDGWQADWEHRIHVLDFLVTFHPAEGWPYVLRGLDDEDRTIRTTALIAINSYVWLGHQLDPDLLDRLKKLVERVNWYSERRWAFMILERFQPDSFGEWLRQFVSNENDWAIRGPALLYFVDKGEHHWLHDLIAALPVQDDDTKFPRSLWDRRHLVPLSTEEASILEDCVESEANKLRDSHDRWHASNRREPSGAALALLGWLNSGVPVRQGDVRRAEEFVESRRRHYSGDRLEVVKRLGRLNHPEVRSALARLTGSRFRGVRREAQKRLEELAPLET